MTLQLVEEDVELGHLADDDLARIYKASNGFFYALTRSGRAFAYVLDVGTRSLRQAADYKAKRVEFVCMTDEEVSMEV